MAAFNDLLQATLTLLCGEETHSIPGGSIETIRIEAHIYGFEGEISFWVSSEGVEDTVFPTFTGSAVILASLEIANGNIALAGGTPTPVAFTGYVTKRSIRETTSADIDGEPMIERCYTLSWADAARVYWSEHRPISLYANTTLKHAISQQAVEGVTIDYDWTTLDLPREIVCLGLGMAQPASFYDFVIGLVSDLTGVFEFDYATNGYRLGAEKTPAKSVGEVEAHAVADLEVLLSEPRRHTTTVLNPFSEATVNKLDSANPDAATGVRQDVIAHTAIDAVATARSRVETTRLKPPLPHILAHFSELPETFPVPGTFQEVGEGFSARIHAAGKKYRAITFRLHCGPPDGEDDVSDLDDAACRFGTDLTVEYERDIDPVPQLPAFRYPKYPVYAEGRVRSASGTPTDRTWHVLAAESDSITRYRVYVPLWNQTVLVPFVPSGESGHFFFPGYQNQRVLLAFDFDQVRIAGFLDWAGRMPLDSQGNQIVMGKRGTSGTVMAHAYTDDSPTLSIVRTQASDVQTLELSEGRFFLEVKEEETEETTDETYDLSPLAEAAKEAASAQTRASVGGLASKFQGSSGKTSAALDAATSELETGVEDTVNEVVASVAQTEATIAQKSDELAAAADELSDAVSQAKGRLKKLLEDD